MMWIRKITPEGARLWHIVKQNDDNAFMTLCGDYTREWHEKHIVEARTTEPLVEDTCGWCLKKVAELNETADLRTLD
jgi:hypothetical protein